MIEVNKIHSFTGHTDSVYNLELISDLKFLSVSGDGNVIEWDLNILDKGKIIAKLPSSVYALCYDKATDELYLGQNFEGVQVLDLAERKIKGSVKLTEEAIFDIKKADGRIYIATGKGELIIIDSNDLSLLLKLKLSNHNLRRLSITTGKIYVACSDHTIKIVDKKSLKLKGELKGHKQSVFSLVNLEDKNRLISAGKDANLFFWDVKEEKKILNIPAHMYAINDICLSPDHNYFATCSMDKSIKLWDLKTLDLLKVIDKSRFAGHGTSVNKLLWMKNKNLLLSCSDDRSISVWDIKFGENII